MLNKQDAHWHCESRDCGWSAVISLSLGDQGIPRCVCGREMTKTQMPPVFSYLDFLRGEEWPANETLPETDRVS